MPTTVFFRFIFLKYFRNEIVDIGDGPVTLTNKQTLYLISNLDEKEHTLSVIEHQTESLTRATSAPGYWNQIETTGRAYK